MLDLNAAKPATANGAPASNVEQLGGRLDVLHTPRAIIAQLVGNFVIASGLEASGAFDLCRLLLDAGADPKAELVCYRNEAIAFRVRSIGFGAKFTIRETANDGPRVVRWKAFSRGDVAAPVRENSSVAPQHQGAGA